MIGGEAGQLTVGQVWGWLVDEWGQHGFGSAAIRDGVMVVTVMVALGVVAAVTLWSWGRRVADNAEVRSSARSEREPVVFESGRVDVGPVLSDGNQSTLWLRPSDRDPPTARTQRFGDAALSPLSGRCGDGEQASQRWDPNRTVEFFRDPTRHPFD